MATMITGPGGRLVVSTPDLIRKIRGAAKLIRQGANIGIRVVANQFKDEVSNGIRSNALGLTPLAPSTIRTRIMGKDAGSTPARPSKRGTAPLDFTGASSKAIRVLVRSEAVFEVSQPDNAFIGYSRSRMTE